MIDNLSHNPYTDCTTVEDKIHVFLTRANEYTKDDFFMPTLYHHLALELVDQKEVYNYLQSTYSDVVLGTFEVKRIGSEGIEINKKFIPFIKLNDNLTTEDATTGK